MRTKLSLLAATTILGASLAAYAAGTGMNIVPKPDMDASYVKQQLADLGYHDFSEVKQVGNLYEVLAARGGHAVNLRVDTQTGRITDLAVPQRLANTYSSYQQNESAMGRMNQAGTAIVPRPHMTAGYVSEHLMAQGYDNVGEVRRKGGTWIADATQDGIPVTVRVDDKSGIITSAANDTQVIPPTADMNATYVKRQLLAMGYDRVTHVKRAGDVFRVKAWEDGQPFDLRVNAKTGRITELSG